MLDELHALQQAEADDIASWATENISQPLADAQEAMAETKTFLDDFDEGK